MIMFPSSTQVLTVLLALGSLPMIADEPAKKAETKPAVVPFEMLISNHMVVTAKLNDKGPYRLIFDLGAPITLLSNRAAEGSGAVKKSTPKSFLFSMRGEAAVKSLEVGELNAKDVPVVVLDHPAIKALGSILGKPLDGIMGFTFFARYKTTIDYQKQEMTFEPVDYEVKDLMKELPNRLAGPKVARQKRLAPGAVLGFTVGAPFESGVKVTEVLKGSPAEAAGLMVGDVLNELDGRWTTNDADTHAAAADLVAGKAAAMAIEREGKPMALTITPIEGL